LEDYLYFPTVSIGGTPGNYILRCPLPSNADYAEVAVIVFSNAGTASMTATVSGAELQQDPLMIAGVTNIFNDQTFIRGAIYRAGVNGVVTPTESWERVTDAQGRIFVTLGAGGVGSPVQGYVSLKVRVHIKNRIPQPATTVIPSEEPQYHQERARRIEAAVLGREGEYEIYGKSPRTPGTTREIETGESIIKGAQRMFKGRGQ